MNRISRFIYAALVVFSAVACHTSEIDNPNKDNPDKPQITDNIQLTASIKQTRVEYSINGEKLEQRWTVGDAIYGFYGGDIANKIVFSVESVDEDTGVASLKPESGWSGFLSAFKAKSSLSVGLVYTGCTTSEIPEDFQRDGTIEVDMTSQGTDRIPACMHANNFSSRTEDDVTYVTFLFENDCSIIEVFGLTGTSESESITGGSAELASIQVSGLIKDCSYTLNTEGGLTFISGTTTGATTVTLDSSKWSITKDGDIIYNGDIKPVFIAAVPFKDKSFTVSAKLIGGINNISVPFDNKTFVGGNSYYIMASPVVARTADGVYFKTVTEAFEHADDLYNAENSIYNSAEKNIVTLVRDCGLAGVEPEDGEYKPVVGEIASIDIDGYDVTLDLNGHTLELGTDDENIWECFQVENTSTFTIKNSGGNGTISSSAKYMIKNSGSVNIINGNFTMEGEESMVLNNNGGLLTITGGTLYSDFCSVVENHGILNVEGGEISSEGRPTIENLSGGEAYIFAGTTISCEDCEVVTNKGNLTIKGGTLTSDAVDEVAITSLDGELKIDGDCTITSTAYHAIDVPGGEFTMSDGYVSGKAGGIQLTDGSTGKIIGGTIESKGDEEDEDGYALYIENSTCTISDGTILNKSTTKPAIYCFTEDEPVEDSPKNLIITWPKEGESAAGPLIVSSAASSDGKSFGAVSTANPIEEGEEKTNYAIVKISGGYLYSSDDAIYSIAGESKVERPDGTYFYTNEASEDQDLKSKPHYFDFNKTAGSNLVSVPYLEGTSITDPVLGTLTFEYKIIPGEGPDVDTNITGGSPGPFDKIYF